jgi:hypothetical protein
MNVTQGNIMFNNRKSCVLAIIACCATTIAHANIIWPGMLIADSIYKTWFLIGISILIEAFFLYLFLRPISGSKAFLMSCVGNAISTFGGTLLSAIGVIGWHAIADPIIRQGTFTHMNWIATIIIMCLLSALIELEALRIIFQYSSRQLFIPVFVGNISTYFLTWGYYYLYMPSEMYPGFRIFG